MILTKVLDTATNLLRMIKSLRYGVAVETIECSPYGIDSNPIKNTTAVYSSTMTSGSEVIIGYVNTKAKALVGETRLYSTDSSGNIKYNVWLTNDGNLRLGVSTDSIDYTDNLVKYNELSDSLGTYNTDVKVILTELATAINAVLPGSVPLPILLDIDISTSKINNILCE